MARLMPMQDSLCDQFDSGFGPLYYRGSSDQTSEILWLTLQSLWIA
jgi:hypothetical protein